MVAEDPQDFVAVTCEQLGWLVGATSPAPLVACPEPVGDVDEVVVAALAARGILELGSAGQLRPTGAEAAVLAVALAADDAVILTSFGHETAVDLAFYADGAWLVAHQHDDEMHGFVRVERGWAVAALAAATGLPADASTESAPATAASSISSAVWVAVQDASDRVAAAALLPVPEGLASAVFDATRVHCVERLHREGDQAPETTLLTMYEGDWGPSVWVVDGSAGATELSVRLVARNAAGSLLAGAMP